MEWNLDSDLETLSIAFFGNERSENGWVYTRLGVISAHKNVERKTRNRVAAISFYLARAPEESEAPVNHAGNYGKGVKAVKNEPDSSINIPTSMTATAAAGTTLYSLLSVSIGVADVRFYSQRSVIRLPGHSSWPRRQAGDRNFFTPHSRNLGRAF